MQPLHTANNQRHTLAELAGHCEQVEQHARAAASALRHGRIITARDAVAAAAIIMKHLERYMA